LICGNPHVAGCEDVSVVFTLSAANLYENWYAGYCSETVLRAGQRLS
jgi:hypothetical protein